MFTGEGAAAAAAAADDADAIGAAVRCLQPGFCCCCLLAVTRAFNVANRA